MQSYLARTTRGTLPVGSTVGTAATAEVHGPRRRRHDELVRDKVQLVDLDDLRERSLSERRRHPPTFAEHGRDREPTTTTTTASPIYGYGYVMADPNADCAAISPPANGGDTIENSSALTVPIFIASSLCIYAASPAIAEPAVEPVGVTQSVTLYVGGPFRTSNSGSPVGTSAKPIKSANIVHGCQAYFKKNWANQLCNTPGTPTERHGLGVFATTSVPHNR